MAHPIAGYDYEKAKELLNIPSEMNLINIIVVGKHNENYKDIFDKEKISSEANRPPRKKLSEFVYIDKYGNPYS